MTDQDEFRRGAFPFENTFRRRYRSFRSRELHGFSSLFDLMALILVVFLGIMFLSLVFFLLLFALLVAPVILLAGFALRWLGLRRVEPYSARRDRRDPDVTIIDVEVDRS